MSLRTKAVFGVKHMVVLFFITYAQKPPHKFMTMLTYSSGLPRQHAISGYHRSASDTPFKWRFAGGPIVARFYKLTGFRSNFCQSFYLHPYFRHFHRPVCICTFIARQCDKYHYTNLTNLSTNYLVMCKVYTDVGGIK